MEIILIQDVDNLGGKNELVKVKNGYARNFLIPQGLAVEANPSNRKQLEERHESGQKERRPNAGADQQRDCQTERRRLLKVGAKTGTSGKIFGSVTSLQISRAIRDQKGYEIDRKKIHITDEVKELGTYKASIDFGNGQHAEVEFEVVAE